MRIGRTALQLARILVLLALLRATEWWWYIDNSVRNLQTPPIETGALWGAWAVVSLLSVLFVVMMLVGRQHWHVWAVLALEAIVASVLAFVPPMQWVLWFGVGGGWITAMGSGIVQPLAVAWLGVVVAVGLRQRRTARAADPRLSPADTNTLA